MNILPIQAEHKTEWQRLWAGFLDFYNHQMDAAVIEKLWKRLLDPKAQVRGFVCEDQGVIVGFVHYITHENSWHDGHYCYLEDLYVDPNQRSSGAGRTLINAVVEQARLENCIKVYWHTDRMNATAQVLYNKLAKQTDFLRYDITL